ncbi:hypothetical protein GGR50DRAFT_642553 [Xylaria sp. CBS 124048]|nr:hypothetical protein GGR50DRAFT_642553 [Xylaria sp. CBS 124048]
MNLIGWVAPHPTSPQSKQSKQSKHPLGHITRVEAPSYRELIVDPNWQRSLPTIAMQALRTRVAGAARRSRPPTLRSSRSYASESHDPHAAPTEEPLGTSFYIFAGALPVSVFFYQISRPGVDGESPSFTKWLKQFDYFNEFQRRNALRSKLIEQAAHDKHLFLNANRNMHIELKTPELFNSGAPWNVPAGHSVNLDHITEHYRKQAAAEEERKAKKLASSSSSN